MAPLAAGDGVSPYWTMAPWEGGGGMALPPYPTGAYFAALLDKLKAELAEKRPHLQKNKILFHQDNAPSHTSVAAMAEIHELRIELLDHPLYSPDLAPSNFFLFSHLKIALEATRGLLETNHVFLKNGQVTGKTLELAPPSPNYLNTPTKQEYSTNT
ncbi:histone-lysine N-methyltransferase SETMAR [Trichonephila clavipes]|nr:histone-lysine N-methyltransferase SETMAR [Trichonephila clavipes]